MEEVSDKCVDLSTERRWDPLGAPNDDNFDFDKLDFCDEHHQ